MKSQLLLALATCALAASACAVNGTYVVDPALTVPVYIGEPPAADEAAPVADGSEPETQPDAEAAAEAASPSDVDVTAQAEEAGEAAAVAEDSKTT